MVCSKRSSSSSAAAIIGGNDDLSIEILVWLPARTLVRLKVVSKRWRSIISAPSFCRAHTLHHPRRRPETRHSFILRGNESNYFVCDPSVRRLIPFRFGFPSVAILQSCNGLLLLRYGRKRYCVFNPTTMQCRDLSLPTSGYVQGLCLMFDPSLSPHYRVVAFLLRKNHTFFYAYDSETREWKLGGECMNKCTSFRQGIYLNGGIYFIRARSSSFRFIPDDDLSNIPDPPHRLHSAGRQWNYGYAAESNGVLLCLTLSLEQGRNALYVHETKEIEKGWTKSYRADLYPLLATFGAVGFINMDLLGVMRGEKEQDSLFLLHLPRKIVIYRFWDAVFEVLVDLKSEKFHKFRFRDAHQFVQCLAPV